MTMEYPPLPGLYPKGWYWIARDNRVYSAPKQLVVDTSDPGYIEFVAQNNGGTFWPDDDDGNQTDAALDAVINPHGLYRDPKAELHWYAGDKRWRTEVSGITVTVGSTPRKIGTNVAEQSKVSDLKTAYDNNTRNGTVSFKCVDGTFFAASEQDVTTIYTAIHNHVELCFTKEGEANAAINAGTCTTHDQVDAFFAGIPNLGLNP